MTHEYAEVVNDVNELIKAVASLANYMCLIPHVRAKLHENLVIVPKILFIFIN